jgi:hypothetical protein
MKAIVANIFLVLLFASAQAQESISLKFTLLPNDQYSISKVQLIILDKSYTVSLNEPLLIKLKPDYKSSLEIKCKASSIVPLSYFFNPYPGQNYEFELGENRTGFYITLKNIDVVKLGLLPGIKEDTTKGNDPSKDVIRSYRNSLGISYNVTNEGKAATVRDEWIKRGGKVNYFSVMATGTYFRVDMDKYGTMDGFGGGASLAINRINLQVPEYSAGAVRWNSMNIGAGIDINVYSTQLNTEASGITMDMKMSYLDMMVTGNFGWTWCFGKFLDESSWKGVALTLKYRPSFRMTTTSSDVKVTGMKTISSSSTDGSFNAGGVGFDVDFNSFSATMSKLAPKPKSKVSFFVLPPIGSNPLYVSLSYGLTFYTK